MIFNSLEEKCRYYQSLTNYKVMPNSYIICHLDGRGFSKCIKNKMEKPFDIDFANMMDQCAKTLCAEVQGCKLAYVQSDEISLLLTDLDVTGDGKTGDIFFDGRLSKINSVCASICTAKFNQLMIQHDIDLIPISKMPLYVFDCKCWVVPNGNDAFAWFLFRHIDCLRNSKQQFAQTYCMYDELVRKNADEQVIYCKEHTGADWNDIADGFKYGRYVFREEKTYTNKERNTDYIRHEWTIKPGFSLTDNKELFLNTYPIFK